VMLGVSGDFDSARMKARLAELFAGWTAEQPPVAEFPKVKEGVAPGVYLAERRNLRQAFFAVGHASGQLSDKDSAALEVAGYILGGTPHSRLVERVRNRLGSAYEISAQWAAGFGHPGLFRIVGIANSVSPVDTLKAIREEVERMRVAEATDDELRNAKDAALDRLAFALDSKAKTLARIMSNEYYGYAKDAIQQYQKGLAAVTRADYVTFTSSSTVKYFFAALDGAELSRRTRLASIGPVTSDALRERGLEPDVEATRHDIDGLVQALVDDADRA